MTEYCDYGFLMKHIICSYSYWDGPLSAYIKVNDEILFADCVNESDEEDKGGDNYREYKLVYLEWSEKYQEWIDDYKEYYHHCFYNDGKKAMFYDGRNLKPFSDKYNGWHPAKDYTS